MQRYLVILLICSSWTELLSAMEPDAAVLKAQDIRVLTGKHLTLYTDVPSSPEVDELPAVFDAAVPLWQAYFQTKRELSANWQVRGFLMRDRKRFVTAKLLPTNLPEFPNGYAMQGNLYMHDQSSPYYRRHLLLHEGTHLFQVNIAQIQSQQWYAEGVAEFLGTHTWEKSELALGVFPKQAKQFPKWGRIELLNQARQKYFCYDFPKLYHIQPNDFYQTESYAWVWAATTLLNKHPRYRDEFQVLQQRAHGQNIDELWEKFSQRHAATLDLDFQQFVADVVYGYDWERTALEFQSGKPFPQGVHSARVAVRAERGWQSTKIEVQQGQTYRITAQGKALLRREPEPWPSEANGITLRYQSGIPLGTLLGAIIPAQRDQESQLIIQNQSQTASFMQPIVLGKSSEFTAPRMGTLYLKINDSAAEISDNQQGYEVEILRLQKQ
jgi:hypothetical protein